MSTLFEQQGPWLPMRQGMPVPLTTIDSDPLVRICFNEEWQPHVLTALKLLTRPEAYVGALPDVQAAVREAHSLMGSIQDGCDFTNDCSPVAYQYFEPFEGHYNTPGNAWQPLLANGCTSFQRTHVGFKQMYSGLADMCLHFRDRVTNEIVGMHIVELRVYANDGTLTPVWQIAWDDCVFGPSFASGVGPVYVKNSFDAKAIAVSGLANFSYSITTDGPVACAPA